MADPRPLALLSILGLIVAASLALAQGGGAEVREEPDKFVMENEEIRVWFQGKKPMLKVFDAREEGNETVTTGTTATNTTGTTTPTPTTVTTGTTTTATAPPTTPTAPPTTPTNASAARGSIQQQEDPDGARYGFFLQEIVEVSDDGDGQITGSEKVQIARLEAAGDWEANVTNDGDKATLTLTRDVEVRPGPGSLGGGLIAGESVHVVLAFTIASGSAATEGTGMESREVAWELAVMDWPWEDPDHTLALRVLVSGGGLETVEEGSQAGYEVSEEGEADGYFTWSTTAEASGTNGTAGGNNTTSGDEVRVSLSAQEDDGTVIGNLTPGEEGTNVWVHYEAGGFAALSHDAVVAVGAFAEAETTTTTRPTFGDEGNESGNDTAPSIPAAGLLGVAALAAAAFVARSASRRVR